MTWQTKFGGLEDQSSTVTYRDQGGGREHTGEKRQAVNEMADPEHWLRADTAQVE